RTVRPTTALPARQASRPAVGSRWSVVPNRPGRAVRRRRVPWQSSAVLPVGDEMYRQPRGVGLGGRYTAGAQRGGQRDQSPVSVDGDGQFVVDTGQSDRGIRFEWNGQAEFVTVVGGIDPHQRRAYRRFVVEWAGRAVQLVTELPQRGNTHGFGTSVFDGTDPFETAHLGEHRLLLLPLPT